MTFTILPFVSNKTPSNLRHPLYHKIFLKYVAKPPRKADVRRFFLSNGISDNKNFTMFLSSWQDKN